MLELTFALSILATVLGTMGFSLAFKDYIASFMAGLIFKRVKHIRPDTRVKILGVPVIKGDIVEIGWLRTTLKEVGEGDRLPSVQTGRTMKIPNFMLFNNPVLIYGETIVDEVLAYVKEDSSQHFDGKHIDGMRKAIEEEGHKVVDIGLYQRDNAIVVHGIFEAHTGDMPDARSKILKRYLESNGDLR